MCYFITVGLAEDKAEFLERHVPRGFHIAAIENASVLQQMGQGFRTYLLTSGGCSCDLFTESSRSSEEDKRQRLRHKYERMGWSAARIERALEQRAKSRGAASSPGLRIDVQRFLGQLAEVAGQVAVVAHWYGGEDVQGARLPCRLGNIVSPEIALAGKLEMKAEEIIRIKARK